MMAAHGFDKSLALSVGENLMPIEYNPHNWDWVLLEVVVGAMARCNWEAEVVGLAAPEDWLLEILEKKDGQMEVVAAAVYLVVKA